MIYKAVAASLLLVIGMSGQAQVKRHLPKQFIDVKSAGISMNNISNLRVSTDSLYKLSRKAGQVTFTKKRQVDGSFALDSAFVTIMFDRDTLLYDMQNLSIYNNNYDFSTTRVGRYSNGGNHVKGIVLKMPLGVYDFYTHAFQYVGKRNDYTYIKEDVAVSKDTTIVLEVTDCKNEFTSEVLLANGDLKKVGRFKYIEEEPWQEMLEDGNISWEAGYRILQHSSYGGVFRSVTSHPDLPDDAGSMFVNDLSDRYHFIEDYVIEGKDGNIYFNHLVGSGSQCLPLKNSVEDYLVVTEKQLATPKGKESKDGCLVQITEYVDDVIEGGFNLTVSEGYEEDVTLYVNAPKSGQSDVVQMDASVQFGFADYKSYYVDRWSYPDENGNIVEVIDTLWNYTFNMTPEMMENRDKTISYLVTCNTTIDTRTPEIGHRMKNGPHPRFSYSAAERTGDFGNSTPLLSILSFGDWNQWANSKQIYIETDYYGRYGERMTSGRNYSTMSVRYNGAEIYRGREALDSLRQAYVGQADGSYEIEFINDNIEVDGLAGKNVTTLYFDQNKEDWNVPVMKMLQFRDEENRITDRFAKADNGVFLLAGGDFEPQTKDYINSYGYDDTWGYLLCQPMTVELSYAPYGSSEWQSIEDIEHQSAYDVIPGIGYFYQGSLAGVTAQSDNGWFDLKIRLVDASGNWQEQTVSPAFRIESLVSTGVRTLAVACSADAQSYSLDGRRLNAPLRGISIVKGSDGTTKKVIRK